MNEQARINDITVKTVIGVEHSVVSKCNAYCHRRASCFELFGFDILLDQNLKPWLIEVTPVGHSPLVRRSSITPPTSHTTTTTGERRVLTLVVVAARQAHQDVHDDRPLPHDRHRPLRPQAAAGTAVAVAIVVPRQTPRPPRYPSRTPTPTPHIAHITCDDNNRMTSSRSVGSGCSAGTRPRSSTATYSSCRRRDIQHR